MNNTVFITGANRGIGLALVEIYLQHGWQVLASYRNTKSAQQLFDIAEQNSALKLHQVELCNYLELQELGQKLQQQKVCIDLLINNAGYYGPKAYGFGNTDVEQWRKVFEINTIAPLKLVEYFYPLLKHSPIKKVACLSSKVGSMSENTSGGGYIYRSSKAALNSVVKSLSNDLKQEGFSVLALHPGWVKTKMGGPNALISTQVSAQGLYQVIEQSSLKNSGQFLDYQGKVLPW